MSISMGFLTFFNSWFVMLFFVSPFFVRPATERGKLDYAAAPQAMQWKKLLLANTLVSIVVTVLLVLLINSGWFDVRDSLT